MSAGAVRSTYCRSKYIVHTFMVRRWHILWGCQHLWYAVHSQPSCALALSRLQPCFYPPGSLACPIQRGRPCVKFPLDSDVPGRWNEQDQGEWQSVHPSKGASVNRESSSCRRPVSEIFYWDRCTILTWSYCRLGSYPTLQDSRNQECSSHSLQEVGCCMKEN